MRRAHPVQRHIELLLIQFFRLVRTGIAAHEIVGAVEDLERNGPGCVGLQVVVDHCAIRWIRSSGLFRRKRRIGVPIPANADCGLRLEELRARRRPGLKLAQGRDVIQYPEGAAMGRDYQIVAMNDKIAHRSHGEIELERLPLFAIVERNEYADLGAGEKQALAFRIFANGVDDSASRQAVDDFIPGLATIVRAQDVRLQVVKADAVDGRVGRGGVKPRGLDERNLAPRRKLRAA